MTAGREAGLHFLTIAEAARVLALPGLRVREAALRGQVPSLRDNEGRLRVDLTGIDALPDTATDTPPLEPKALMELLFDEIEEMQESLASRDSEVSALSDLVVRQGAALERAGAALVSPASAGAGREAELNGLLDRAMELLEAQAAEAETSKRLRISGNKALDLLDRSVKRAEEIQTMADAQARAFETELQTSRARLDQTLDLTELAVESATRSARLAAENTKEKSGPLGRLLGRLVNRIPKRGQ